jgi:hypothetical protein
LRQRHHIKQKDQVLDQVAVGDERQQRGREQNATYDDGGDERGGGLDPKRWHRFG